MKNIKIRKLAAKLIIPAVLLGCIYIPGGSETRAAASLDIPLPSVPSGSSIFPDLTIPTDGSLTIPSITIPTGVPISIPTGVSLDILSGTSASTTSSTAVTSPVAVSGITLDKTRVSLKEGETVRLNATVLPNNATNKTVYWKSQHPLVAKVDLTGLVSAVRPGTAIITAYSANGEKSASCEIEVTKVSSTFVGNVTLNSDYETIRVGDTYQLKAEVSPESASNKTVLWTSSDSNVIRVDSSGLVTAVAEGTAYITAYSDENKDKYATCIFSVIKAGSTSGGNAAGDNSSITALQKKKGKIKSVKAGKKQLKISISKVSVKGVKVKYEIRYKAAGGKWKKVKSSSTTYTLKKLKSGKSYTITVRPYGIIDSSAYYGKWAKTVSKKTK